MHTRLIVLFAQAGGADLPPELAKLPAHQPSVSPEMKIVLGAALAVALAFFIWAVFIRKRRPADPRLKVIEPGPVTDSDPDDSAQHHHHHHHGRRHRRHKKHRSQSRYHHRNPTLAETGGLPPVRPDGELPKF